LPALTLAMPATFLMQAYNIFNNKYLFYLRSFAFICGKIVFSCMPASGWEQSYNLSTGIKKPQLKVGVLGPCLVMSLAL
jgi:hypothetical protein